MKEIKTERILSIIDNEENLEIQISIYISKLHIYFIIKRLAEK